MFEAASVVGCDGWRESGLPQPPDEIVRGGFGILIQYLLSEDKFATNAIRIFVVGESTVRCACRHMVFFAMPLQRVYLCIAFNLFPHFS